MKNSIHYLGLVVICLIVACNSNSTSDYRKENAVKSIVSPASLNSEEPNLINGMDGNLYMTWIEREDKLARLFYSKWEDVNWSTPEQIAEGSDWFVNWADYPAMAVNKVGDKVAHYLQKSDTGTYTYDVKVVAKREFADKWTEPMKLNSDTVNAEHGFVSLLPFKDNSFLVTWLDGRNTVASEDHHDHGNGAMTIRAAILEPSLEIVKEEELDNRVCDCCQTSAALTDQGPIIVYRDRSEEEVRDMSIIRSIDGIWSKPETVYADNWQIAGCPVNGPKLAAKGKQVAVAWFSAPNGEPQVKISFSNDGGKMFADPVKLDQGNAVGRVDIELLDDKVAIVSWLEGENIVAAKVNVEGEILERYNIATSSQSRGSGFPQIALHKNKLMVAWTNVESKSIQMGVLEL